MTASADLVLPHPEPPAPGRLVTVAPGIEWLRLPLPFRLDHVNVYLIEDGDGVAILDTGIDDGATRAVWETLLAGPLAERRPTRVVATHYHPDHVGLAGWLCERCGVPLAMNRSEYLTSRNIGLDPGALDAEPYRGFYRAHGLDAEITDKLLAGGHQYLRMMSGLPSTFLALEAGARLRIGDSVFDVLTGGGHAPDQVMLYRAADGVLLAADQVLARISPNVSVRATEPEGDPLGDYLRSLAALKAGLPEGTLVLPGHDLPFFGLHRRVEALSAHHEGRCETIARACAEAPRSVAELVPVLFTRPLDVHAMGFAFSEAMAHVNRLVAEGRLQPQGEAGSWRFRAAAPVSP